MKILLLGSGDPPPGGLKPIALSELGHTVCELELPEGDFSAAVRLAEQHLDRLQPDLVFGYGRGGAVAMNLKGLEVPLVLLSPAWKQYGAATKVKPSTVLLHATTDESVPLADSVELARNSRMSFDCLMRVYPDSHLADPAVLARLVEAIADKMGARFSSVREAGVPRRFGLGAVFVFTAMGAVLFSALRLLGASPGGIALITVFFVVVALGQAILFRGRHPRRASVIVGAFFYPLLIVATWAWGAIVHNAPNDGLVAIMLFGIIFGAIFGYLAGLLIAGVFLVIDMLQNAFRGQASVKPDR